MDATRRSFIGMLMAGLTLDPERLLWTPNKKVISIPKPIPVQARIFGIDEFVYYPAAVQNPNLLHDSIDKMQDRVESTIRLECERAMLRPKFVDLILPLDGSVHFAERSTDSMTGFKSRALVAYDIIENNYVLRVDSLFYA